MNKNEIQIARENTYTFARLISGKDATIIQNDCGEWATEPEDCFEPYHTVIGISFAENLAKEGIRRCVESKLHLIMPGFTCILADKSLAAIAID